MQCSFFDYKDHKVVFRRYASLYFIVGVEPDTNELSVLEFIHSFVETLDLYFGNVVRAHNADSFDYSSLNSSWFYAAIMRAYLTDMLATILYWQRSVSWMYVDAVWCIDISISW